jgi:hypothetical protein
MMALDTLDEADAWDEELVTGACEWLAANAPAEGGASFVEPTVEGWPHAPWWEAEEGRPASLLTTGQIAATLHARGVEHRWLDGATDVRRQPLPSLLHTTAASRSNVSGGSRCQVGATRRPRPVRTCPAAAAVESPPHNGRGPFERVRRQPLSICSGGGLTISTTQGRTGSAAC